MGPPPPRNQRIAFFHFKVSPIQELGVFCSATHRWSPHPHPYFLAPRTPIKLLCVPSSSLCPSNTGSQGCLPCPYTPFAGGGLSCVLGDTQTSNSGTSAPASSSSLGSVLLVAAPAWAHHLFPGPSRRPPPSFSAWPLSSSAHTPSMTPCCLSFKPLHVCRGSLQPPLHLLSSPRSVRAAWMP